MENPNAPTKTIEQATEYAQSVLQRVYQAGDTRAACTIIVDEDMSFWFSPPGAEWAKMLWVAGIDLFDTYTPEGQAILSEMLRLYDCELGSSRAAVALIRSTYAGRNELKNWRECVIRVRDYYNANSDNDEKLRGDRMIRGLLE